MAKRTTDAICISFSWLADRFAELEKDGFLVTKIQIRALFTGMSEVMERKKLWNAEVILDPTLPSNSIVLTYKPAGIESKTCRTRAFTLAP